ncbi:MULTISPECIES: hypothetical protein [Halococcus]|uniref:Uncharacterized protein n=1 Tax=Halococcus salifodinae DSM 8989 TaxID=1227456 RepID=M0N441_9EURY|nr:MULTISPECIES: hypothetical protein [Halococcus]EMA52707.1 hypothetical protein C450_11438 [Halococcus salifodinae DSM 8989]
MVAPKHSPGPAAEYAFRTGMIAAALVGLTGIGFLYWTGTIALLLAGYSLVLLFPLYLVAAAVVLSVWLGYNTDATDLRPVYRNDRRS